MESEASGQRSPAGCPVRGGEVRSFERGHGLTRSYASFSQAAAENGESRIYAGIHFRSAVEDGIAQGRKIGGFVFTHALQPLDQDDGD